MVVVKVEARPVAAEAAAAKAAKAVAVAMVDVKEAGEEPATQKSKVEVMMQWKDELLLLLCMESQGPGRCPRR